MMWKSRNLSMFAAVAILTFGASNRAGAADGTVTIAAPTTNTGYKYSSITVNVTYDYSMAGSQATSFKAVAVSNLGTVSKDLTWVGTPTTTTTATTLTMSGTMAYPDLVDGKVVDITFTARKANIMGGYDDCGSATVTNVTLNKD